MTRRIWKTDNAKSHNLTVRVLHDDYGQLQELAERENTTVSKLVKEAIWLLLLSRQDLMLSKIVERRKSEF